MDITNLDANVWQYFFAFMEHNKIFTLILVFMAAVFLLLIKKIVKIPCNIFTGKIDSTKMMLSEWEKDILIFSGNKHHFADDYAKNILFNRLAEKILRSYYLWKNRNWMTLSRKSCLLTQLLRLNIRHPNWMLPVKNGRRNLRLGANSKESPKIKSNILFGLITRFRPEILKL